MKGSSTKNGITILFVILLILMVIIEFVTIPFFDNPLMNEMTKGAVSRMIGGVMFIIILISFGYKHFFTWETPSKKVVLIVLAGLVISVNNFPFIAYFNGQTGFSESSGAITLFFVETLSIGFFEELVFRGVILILFLQRMESSTKGVFLSVIYSSALFGAIHLINILLGAGVGPTLLQVGYSFLMGMLWAVVFIKTKTIWYPVLLHALYNICGSIFVRVGFMFNRFDPLTVIITVLFAVVVAGFMGYELYKTSPEEVREFVTVT